MRRSFVMMLAASLLALAGIFIFRLGWFQNDPAPTPTGAGVAQTLDVDDVRVTMQLDETVIGRRTITVLVQDHAGRPVAAQSVRLRFSMAEMAMGTIEADALPVDAGRFEASGSFFTMVGRWNVDAILMLDNRPPYTLAFAFPIALPGEASGPLNPLTADATTLAAARPLYQANCATCHGISGKGDGPTAVGLRPAPSDFTQHMQVGKHTDGQVFLWIRDGYPGTAMPPWGGKLTDEQIWQLVTYLRSLPQQGTGSIATAATQSPAPQSTQPTNAPISQEALPPLVFVREGNIWWSDGAGGKPHPLTSLEEGQYAEYPTLAPHDDQIAFVTTSQGPLKEGEWPQEHPTTNLYVMQADGSNLRLLWTPEQGRLGLTAWSPTGDQIYVGLYTVRSVAGAAVPDRVFQIVRIDPRSGEREVAREDAYDPTFSADGTLMAYLRWHNESGSFTLNVAALAGSGEREVLSQQVFSNLSAPRFSPDGQRLLFTSTTGPPVDEQGLPLTTSDQTLSDQLGGLFAPGAAHAHGAAAEIWSIALDGSGLRRLTTLGEDTPMAVFSPDGQEIVLMGAGGIYRMDADGRNLRKIDALGDHGGLDWGVSSTPP